MDGLSIIIPSSNIKDVYTYENYENYYNYYRYINYDQSVRDCEEWRDVLFDNFDSEEILSFILDRQKDLENHIKVGIITRDFSKNFDKYLIAIKNTITLCIKIYRKSKVSSSHKTKTESYILSNIGRSADNIEHLTISYRQTKCIWNE